MKESEGKWRKVKENERKWKKMKENDQKWKKIQRKYKENEKWKKMKENERKWKKMKENEKMKKKKNEKKKGEKWWKRKKNEKNWIHTQNHRRFPGFTVVVVTFFRQNPLRFPWFCFGMSPRLFPDENQQPVLVCNRFSEEKWQFSLDVPETKTHILQTKMNDKKSLRSAHLTIKYIFRII